MLMPIDRPKSQVVMVAAWLTDLIWFPAMAFGEGWVRAIGVIGFCASLFVWWAMMSIYSKGKIAGRYVNLQAKPWDQQVW